MMDFEIKFVDETKKNEVSFLRKQEYAKASGYSLDLNTLDWKQSDNESYIMVAIENGTIVSTMRGEIIQDQVLLEKKLECPWMFKELKLPVLLLSRAATIQSHQSKGLNLILRYWFLRLAEFYNLPQIVGTFVTQSPRQNTMQLMGYEFFDNPLGWQQSTYRSHRPVIVATLDMKSRSKQALAYCENEFKKNNSRSYMNTTFPAIRYVRCL